MKVKQTMILAPIVLFVYNRLWHTRQTVEALQKNETACDSQLFIFSDGAKDEDSLREVENVRAYLKTIKGFNKITIIERDINWGLADNIIDGVSAIITKYGKVIVLEDDIVTSPQFLNFMNNALIFYENEKRVWHISGWNYPIETAHLEDTFLWRAIQCWGWATWQDRWKHFEKNPQHLIENFTQEDIYAFDLEGINFFWQQVIKNAKNQINTWAVFWYATFFRHKGLCLSPSQTYVYNIGFDGSGIHCDTNDIYTGVLNTKQTVTYTHQIEENEIALNRIKLFYRENIQIKNDTIAFSKSLGIVYNYLSTLKRDDKYYIVYGAGFGAKLIINFMPTSIVYMIDQDISKQGDFIENIPIYYLDSLHKNPEYQILISPFGRAKEIMSTLHVMYNVPMERMVSLDILND